MYVCHWLTRSLLFYVDVYMYVCYVCISLYDMIMIVYDDVYVYVCM